MALIISGPHPSNTNQVVLPNPLLSNTDSLGATVQVIRMMDGSARTHIKPKSQRRKFRWSFQIGRSKLQELEDFTISFSGFPVRVFWRNETFIGWITLNPMEANGEIGETFRTTIEFEEKK
jgi:hypothetical protein